MLIYMVKIDNHRSSDEYVKPKKAGVEILGRLKWEQSYHQLKQVVWIRNIHLNFKTLKIKERKYNEQKDI